MTLAQKITKAHEGKLNIYIYIHIVFFTVKRLIDLNPFLHISCHLHLSYLFPVHYASEN